MKRKMLANTYGSAFPLKQEFDRKILSRYSLVYFQISLPIAIYTNMLLVISDAFSSVEI